MTRRFFTAALTALLLMACAVKERTEPVVDTFLDGAPRESTVADIPFLHAWIAPQPTPIPYRSIYIKPVRTDLLPKDMWLRSRGLAVSSAEEFQKDAEIIARYFRIRLLSELKSTKSQRFLVVDTPDSKSLILEIAITELVLSEPIIRAAALAVPFPGVDLALSTISDPHVSFAARFTSPDGKTLIATAADRRFPPVRLIDLNKLRARSSAREIIAHWSRQLAQAIQLNEFKNVEGNTWFSILPW
ncbi:MAG: DUF3313 family protein [Pseudomonadota bacterium]|jgi:hypothetical protein